MNRLQILTRIPGLLALAVMFNLPPAAAETNNTQSLVAGNTAFAFELYARLAREDGNLFFSPASISTCLGMVNAGARGGTEKEMAQVLHFPADQPQLHTAFGALQKQLNDAHPDQGIELAIANGLWAQADFKFLPAFLDTAGQNYGANLQQVDFRTGAEPARQEINAWVGRQTREKITDLLPPGLVDASTRLVLVNAIYFKGKWTHPFNRTNTATAPFSTAPGRTVPVRMMNLSAGFKYAEIEGGQLLELPYLGGNLSLALLLPREIDGLKTLEPSLTPEKLGQWLARARSRKVNVFLPRFRLTHRLSLADTLRQMGMAAPFTRRADFSGMTGGKNLFLSAIVHKAFVDVGEEGTEAAAATGAVMTLTGLAQPPPVFRADHPFIFLIREAGSGSILFLGRMANP